MLNIVKYLFLVFINNGNDIKCEKLKKKKYFSHNYFCVKFYFVLTTTGVINFQKKRKRNYCRYNTMLDLIITI